MTIANTSRLAGPFIGNSVQTAFPFSFKVFSGADVSVVRTETSTGIATTLTLNSDYTVSLSTDQNANPGGTVVLSSPLATGSTLVLTTNLPATQTLDLTNNGGFYPRTISDALDRIVILIQQMFSNVGRSVKFPLGDTANADLPPAAQRANNLLGFDATGKPVAVMPAAQSASALQAVLGAFTGASLIGFVQSGSTFFRTALDKLRDNVNARDFGALGDGTDQTAAFVKAAAYSIVRVPAGTYVIDTINISKSVTFDCDPGAIFQRKAGADIASAGYNTMTAMFVVNTNGVSLRFVGAPTFDGNYTNQTTVEPGGAAIKITVPDVVGTAPIELYVENAQFVNGTSDYIMVRGDSSLRRYVTRVTLVNPTFTGGVYGKGKGDPSTPTALGYTPAYNRVLDYVIFRTYDFKASFDRPLSLGLYAPMAIWGTFAGADYTTSGNASILMYGRTNIDNMGRASYAYNDQTNFTLNNGIGCIDGYGNIDEIFIEDIKAKNSQFCVVRAKGSCRLFTVLKGDFQSCWRALQVGPSSTGPCQSVINIGAITCRDGVMPQLEFAGSSPTDQLYSIDIDSAYCFGAQTNPEALGNQGNVRIANAGKFTARALTAIGSPSNGVAVADVDRTMIGELVINTNTGAGLRVSGTGQFILGNFDIRNCGAQGIFILPGMTDITIYGGRINGAVDYGVLNQSTGNTYIQNVSASNITSLSRGFYNAGGTVTLLGNSAGPGVTTPLFAVAGVLQREEHNSWNPRSVWGGFSTTTSGTWAVGDRVLNNAPTPGGNIGWVCTTAGSPGTFKTYGTVAA